jgi:tungstate transport system ATP-binding protein
MGQGLVLNRGGRRLLDGVDLRFDGQGLLAILGPNGAGKSLLLRVLAGLIKPDDGRVEWAGSTPDRRRATRLGFVFQKPVMLRRSVLANVEYALASLPEKLSRTEKRQRAEQALEHAGLTALAKSPARVLSGGEQQRLAITRALALKPEILLLDEPTASLDPAQTGHIEKLIADARDNGTGTGIVLISHDRAQARRLADEVLFLHKGQIAERTATRDFFESPQSEAAQAYLDGRLVY